MRVSTRNRVLKIITATVTTLLMGIVLILSFQNVGVSAPITTWTELADTPLPVDTAAIPNDHLQYAITWFSLAAIWIAMSIAFILRARRAPKKSS